jgi:hypothetical protein
VTYIPVSLASLSRCSRVGWEVSLYIFSSFTSCSLVNFLRVRRVLIDSEEDTLVVEEVRENREVGA